MNKRQLQILLISLIFSTILVYVTMPSMLNLAVINQDRVVSKVGDVEVTTGDTLTVFALFASTVTVAVWLSKYRRRGEET